MMGVLAIQLDTDSARQPFLFYCNLKPALTDDFDLLCAKQLTVTQLIEM